MSRLKEWNQAIAVIGSIVVTLVACFAFMQAEHNSIRNEMRDGFAELRGAMRGEHAEMRGEHAEMRDRLNSIDRRTARIEGLLFGIEIPQEPADEE